MNVPPLHLPPGVSWIDTEAALSEALPALRDARELALDTEADSYYVYRVKVCLLQISTRSRNFLIDPLAGLDLAPIGALCADAGVLKVLHAGQNDIALLRQRHGFEFARLFDTMLAAQVLGLRRPGLAALLQERFDVEQKKTYQTSDWGKRPLSPGQLQYAAADTRFLLELKDQLQSELIAKGRLEEAEEEFERLRPVGHTERTFDPDAFRRTAGAHALDPTALRVLQELFLLRDRIAERRDRSPHRVFPDSALLAIARAQPRRREELLAVHGVPRWQVEREETALLEAVEEARRKGPLTPERRHARGLNGDLPLNETQKRVFEALRQWRRERALARDVDESRVATTGTLRQLAREPELTSARLPEVPGMSRFRVREYGEEIVKIVNEARSPAR